MFGTVCTKCHRAYSADWQGPCPFCEVERLQADVKRLETLTEAQSELIDWYEEEHGVSEQDRQDLPEEVQELMAAVEAAKAAGGESDG